MQRASRLPRYPNVKGENPRINKFSARSSSPFGRIGVQAQESERLSKSSLKHRLELERKFKIPGRAAHLLVCLDVQRAQHLIFERIELRLKHQQMNSPSNKCTVASAGVQLWETRNVGWVFVL